MYEVLLGGVLLGVVIGWVWGYLREHQTSTYWYRRAMDAERILWRERRGRSPEDKV